MATLKDFIIKYPSIEKIRQYVCDGLPVSTAELIAPLVQFEKTVVESVRLRNEGNAYYRSNKYRDALKCYSESIAHAPINSQELALAYGNRSAVLQRVEKYELCLLDVNRALVGPLPESSKEKLLQRKETCWREVKAHNSAKLKVKHEHKKDLCQSKSGGSHLDPAMRKVLCTSQMGKNETDLHIDYSLFDDPVWNTKFHNPLLPNTSSKVKLIVSEKYGRHLVATDDIMPGEVLLVQEKFAMKVHENELYEHCAYCGLLCEALIPCLTCAKEMYCCTLCRQKAYNEYHRTECKILPLLPSYNDGRQKKFGVYLPLRVFLIGTKQGSKLKHLLNNPKVFAAIDGELKCDGVRFDSNDYLTILSLLWKKGDKFLTPMNRVHLNDLIPIFIALRRIRFFSKKGEHESQVCSDLTDVELFAVLLLLHHLSLRQTYLVDMYASFLGSRRKPSKFGIAFGTLQHFMNHSCEGNVAEVQNKRHLLVFCEKPIKAGEQIFTRYGTCYKFHCVEDRQANLKEYHNFLCSCRACVERWPLKKDLIGRKNEYSTSDVKVIKKIKNMHTWLLKTHHQFEKGQDNLQKAFDFMKTLHEYVKVPSWTLSLCEDAVEAFMEQKGNYYVLDPMAIVGVDA